jgi:hypothetical protein
MENEYLSNKLYEHMKGKCSYLNHSGIAIYFCISKDCIDRYLCSECIIEQIDHFTNHIKSLLPLDNKSKFTKFINLTVPTTSQNNSNSHGIKDRVVDFYTQLKETIDKVLDKHMNENIDKLCHNIEEKEGGVINNKEATGEILQGVNKDIENFITNKDKTQFCDLYESIVAGVSKLNEKLNKKIYFENKPKQEVIEVKINELVSEHFEDTTSNQTQGNQVRTQPIRQPSSRNENKLFTFAEEYDGESKLNQTSCFEDISNFSKAMGFNRDFGFNQTFGKREEILNTLNTETSEEDHTRRDNIQSRLNNLRNKLSKMKL